MRGVQVYTGAFGMLRASGLVGLVLLGATATFGAEAPGEHPLRPLAKYAEERYRAIEGQVRDYTCTVVRREQIEGRLSEPEFLFMKLRHGRREQDGAVSSFAVYLRFLSPPEIRDREVIFYEGRYDGKLIVRRGGFRMPYVTVALDPHGELAMQGNRYPITEIGFKNLLKRLLEVGAEDMHHGECEVKYYAGAKVSGRVCTMVEITHPLPRPYFRYHLARIFIDDELQVPIRYAAYDWPEAKGGPPRLMEEYTYLDLKLNAGLTDADFDHRNENYNFRKDFELPRAPAGH
jgi:hypothetical protein